MNFSFFYKNFFLFLTENCKKNIAPLLIGNNIKNYIVLSDVKNQEEEFFCEQHYEEICCLQKKIALFN